MDIDADAITNSPLAINILTVVAGGIPLEAGHRLADFVGGLLSRQRSSRLVRAVRANQWVALGEPEHGEALDRAVRDTLRNSARSVFDLYHYLRNLEAANSWIVLDKSFDDLTRRSEFDQRGLLVAGIHLSGFDLVLRWFCKRRIQPLVLTVPLASGGRRTEFEMRRRDGMNIVPANVAGLRAALRHLQRGGAVLTGIDRPIPRPRLQPRFFGRESALPVHHIVLATRAQVPIVLVASSRQEDGKYHAVASTPIEMSRGGGAEDTTLRDAERVLQVVEALIRAAPQQWSVPLPVWPSAMEALRAQAGHHRLVESVDG